MQSSGIKFLMQYITVLLISVHRIINCKYNFYKWNIKENPFYIFRSHFDIIEHHFYLCGFSKLFWENVENWFVDLLKLSIKLTFTICEILFGYSLFKKSNITTTIFNWVINWGKGLINYNYLPPAAEGRGREIIKRLPYVRACVHPSVHHVFA